MDALIQFHLNAKQELFFRSRARFTAYGGARGGGKSWSARRKAELMALYYPGIRILMLRRTIPELRENIIRPMRTDLRDVATYRELDKSFSFPNGSLVLFGYCAAEADVDQYQGQEYDVIFMDEATHFLESQFLALTACLRGANDFPKRFYLTCNPGGVGHAWVKRLFIDRHFRAGESPEDYRFIAARVMDNPDLLRNDPGYLRMLQNLPDAQRAAWLDGSWDVFAGQYFTEWDREVHVCEPFAVPEWWRWYVSLDYGLDMLAAYLIAVDDKGRAWVTREIYQGKDLGPGADGLPVHQAAQAVRALGEGRQITAWLAPPDLWATQRDAGKSTAQLFAEHGVPLSRATNGRVSGWLNVKEWLRVYPDERGQKSARLRIFRGCVNLIRTLPQLQYDDKRPSDTATEPHELTHAPDALRYFCASWSLVGERAAEPEERGIPSYEEFMAGDDAQDSYLSF